VFGIGGWEFLIIAVVALLLFGPDKLPDLARTLGRFMGDFKRYRDIMESTIRAEMYASSTGKPDPFKKGKEFREKVAATKPAAKPEPGAPEAEAPEGEAPDADTPEPGIPEVEMSEAPGTSDDGKEEAPAE